MTPGWIIASIAGVQILVGIGLFGGLLKYGINGLKEDTNANRRMNEEAQKRRKEIYEKLENHEVRIGRMEERHFLENGA